MQYTLVNSSGLIDFLRSAGRIALCATLLAVIQSDSLRADEVQLKNGHLLRGRVLSVDKDEVVLQVPEGKMWIRRSRVESILRLDPRKTLLDECQRRLTRGSPGSAIPFLRQEYHHSQFREDVLPLFRSSLLGEVETLLKREMLEEAIQLWNEYCSLPGSNPDGIPLRSRVLVSQQLLHQMQMQIHNELEADQPRVALEAIDRLLERFPSERWRWNQTRIEQMLELGRRLHDSGDLQGAAPLLIEVAMEDPRLLPRVRSAIAHCASRGWGLSVADAMQLKPQEPALYLAAADEARSRGQGLLQSENLSHLRDLIGEPEINTTRILQRLEKMATMELAGQQPQNAPLEEQVAVILERIWNDWSLPHSPPTRVEMVSHDDVESMQQVLGIHCGSALLVVDQQYGRVLRETLHLVPSDPGIDQDALPRELLRKELPRILGQPRYLPPWLEEGLCSMVRGPLARARDRMILARATQLGSLPSLETLIEMKATGNDELYRAACGSLVTLITADIPPILLPDVLDSLSTKGLEAFLSEGTGADTLHQLQQQWLRGLTSEL